MTRSRASAKKAGTAWESAIVKALIDHGWPHAERRRLSGSRDRGDIAGVPGVVIEAKDTTQLRVAAAVDEANAEAVNARAAVGVAWFKRKGKPSPLDGYVLMSGDTFLRLIAEPTVPVPSAPPSPSAVGAGPNVGRSSCGEAGDRPAQPEEVRR